MVRSMTYSKENFPLSPRAPKPHPFPAQTFFSSPTFSERKVASGRGRIYILYSENFFFEKTL